MNKTHIDANKNKVRHFLAQPENIWRTVGLVLAAGMLIALVLSTRPVGTLPTGLFGTPRPNETPVKTQMPATPAPPPDAVVERLNTLTVWELTLCGIPEGAAREIIAQRLAGGLFLSREDACARLLTLARFFDLLE